MKSEQTTGETFLISDLSEQKLICKVNKNCFAISTGRKPNFGLWKIAPQK